MWSVRNLAAWNKFCKEIEGKLIVKLFFYILSDNISVISGQRHCFLGINEIKKVHVHESCGLSD